MTIEIRMTEEDYHHHCNDCNGVCQECGEIRIGSTEPDAENYPCEECGNRTVLGMELAMVLNVIEISD